MIIKNALKIFSKNTTFKNIGEIVTQKTSETPLIHK